jgi:hypothetical protein
MANIYIVPEWFFGYDVMLEFAFAIITLIVGFFAIKIYRLSGQRQSKFFGISFFLISTSYFFQSLSNLAMISSLGENICTALQITSISTFNALGIYAHMIFFGLGVVTLTYMTFQVKSTKPYSLLAVIVLLSILFSANQLFLFYLLCSVMLIYICIHYLLNYFKHRKASTLLVLVAFIFLLFGKIHFIFSVNHGNYYVIGHVLGFIGYILILINLILLIRK